MIIKIKFFTKEEAELFIEWLKANRIETIYEPIKVGVDKDNIFIVLAYVTSIKKTMILHKFIKILLSECKMLEYEML